jgi:glycosyltransferase involved in cell wall biosynthesis
VRVLICNWRDLAHPNAGGAEVYAHEIARRWVAAGHRVTHFSSAVAGLPAQDSRDGVTLVRAGSRAGVYAAARRWYQREGRGEFDLVIDAVNTRPFGCARWINDAPVVALVHQVCREIWFSEFPAPLAAVGRWVAEPWWLRGLRDVPVFTVSESSRTSLLQYGLRNVDIIGVGTHRSVRPVVARERRPTVVFLGRLAANKRPGDALAAFAGLRRQRPDAQMWVIGDGPQRAQLEASRPAGVQFFGRVDEPRRNELLARAHVLVVTSVREGWGMVVDEAAAMGTPTVGYDRPGLRDSISAAGGTLVEARVAALTAGLVDGLATWMARPATNGWRGGARGWEQVAADFLDRANATNTTPTPSLASARPDARMPT